MFRKDLIILREAVHGAASLASHHWMIRKEVKASLDDTVRLPARLCLILYHWQKKVEWQVDPCFTLHNTGGKLFRS